MLALLRSYLRPLILSHFLRCQVLTLALPLVYRTQILMKLVLWEHHTSLMVCICIPYSRTSLGFKSASAHMNYDYVNWYECSSIAHAQLPSHCLQLDLVTSTGLRVPHDLIPSSLPLAVRNAPSTELESRAELNRNSMSVYHLMIAKSTLSLLRSANVLILIFVVVENYSGYSKRFKSSQHSTTGMLP